MLLSKIPLTVEVLDFVCLPLKAGLLEKPMYGILSLIPHIREKSGQLLDSRAHPYYGTSYITHDTSTHLKLCRSR
jgi:hypothetical protein